MRLNANHSLGYDKDEKGNLVINEAQAAIVRRVFDEFMNGLNPEVIAAELNIEGVPGCMGEPKWVVSTIMNILQNEKYKGNALLQKYCTSGLFSKKSIRNMRHYTDLQPFTCKIICGKCGLLRRTWTQGSQKIWAWQCGKSYQQKGVAGCKSGNFSRRIWRKPS